jgi:two-component system KDP operon response regulator KdpE
VNPAILIVEDEVPMRRVLRSALGSQGYYVWEAGTKGDGLATFARRAPQAILLDLGLPDGEGTELITKVRERSDVPILIISARGEERDQVRALDSGANDYVTKPFREAELLARLRAALRSAASLTTPRETRLEVGPLRLHLIERKVYVHDQEVAVTPTEFSLLKVMAWQAGRVVTHRQLLREVWGVEYVDDIQYLRVFMRQLRRKLEQNPARPQLLVTTPGVGYRLMAPE